jgi:tetratricopeptide (TPR) repeat protein
MTDSQIRTPSQLPSIIVHGPAFLIGKVVVNDGTPLTESVVIQSICNGNIRNETHSDFKGNFSFQVNNPTNNVAEAQVDGDISGAGFGGEPGRQGSQRDMSRCDLQAVLPGFTSQTLTLAGRVDGAGTANVGTIVLHRLQQVEGFSISATSAAAPDKAKKEFEKGREDAKKEKWDSANVRLAKAVEIYPKYAVAWLELGRVQLQRHDPVAAKASFHQAVDADPKFTSPYEELARLALQEKQWGDLVQITDQLLKLNSLSYPQHWFYNSLGNYFLLSYDQAEKAARQGLAVDVQHQVPRLEYLLGIILIQKHNYQEAMEHMKSYVRLAPKATDLDLAQKQIAELGRLTAPTTAPSK